MHDKSSKRLVIFLEDWIIAAGVLWFYLSRGWNYDVTRLFIDYDPDKT